MSNHLWSDILKRISLVFGFGQLHSTTEVQEHFAQSKVEHKIDYQPQQQRVQGAGRAGGS